MPRTELPAPRIFTDDGRPATEVCAKCGYWLIGLPSEGNCPECGAGYTDQVVLIYGNGRGSQHATLSSAKRKTLIIVGIGAAIVGIAALYFSAWNGRGLLAVTVLVGLWAAFGLAGRQSRHPGLAQVRLNRAGCVQFNDLSVPSIWRGRVVFTFLLSLSMLAGTLLTNRPFHTGDLLGPAIFLVIFLASLRKNEREIVAAGNNPRWRGLLDDWQRAIPTAWADVEGVEQTRATAAGHHRLKITAVPRGNRLRPHPVDMEFPCSDDEAERLRTAIATWRAAAVKPVTSAFVPHPSG